MLKKTRYKKPPKYFYYRWMTYVKDILLYNYLSIFGPSFSFSIFHFLKLLSPDKLFISIGYSNDFAIC